MRRALVSVAVCCLTLGGCGLLSASPDTPEGQNDGGSAASDSTGPTNPASARATTEPVDSPAPFWVVTKSTDRLTQTLAYNHRQLGPLTITITYDAVPETNGWVGAAVTATVDSSGEAVFEWATPADTYDQFEFAGAPQFPNSRAASVVPSPVDGLGHVFFDWGNDRLPGVSYLLPVETGFDDQGTFTDPFTTGIYGATVEDVNDDGAFEISQIAEGCAPTCPLSGDTITLAWNGSTYAANAALSTSGSSSGSSSGVSATSPPATAPSPPVASPGPQPTAVPTPPQPQYEFFTTPQLGTEPVRGSGCGGDGTLGDVIPDGWWYGYSYPWGSSSFEFDLVCIYYGRSARPHVTECLDGPQPDACLTYFSEDFWMVNNNDRTRTVNLSPDIAVVNRVSDSCPGWNVTSASNLSLIHIVNGRAVRIETRCLDGS